METNVTLERPQYSQQNMSFEAKTTCNIGQIVPVGLLEVLPGDKVDLNIEFLTKLQPLATPAMQNLNAYVHAFYMPFRAMWANWEYFISRKPAPGGSTPPLHPTILFNSQLSLDHAIEPVGISPYHNNLAPYFGLDTLPGGADLEVSAFPFLMYQHIYNNYYRHEHIQEDIAEHLIIPDGTNVLNHEWNRVRFRTYKDDYFTHALQSPQFGDEAQLIVTPIADMLLYKNANPATSVYSEDVMVNVTGGANSTARIANSQNTTLPATSMYIQKDSASAVISFNDIIELQRMQDFLVRQNVAGNRYNEFIKANFGVIIPDLRLQRPDYIYGIKAPIMISELLNTAEGQGTQTGQGNGYSEGGNQNYEVLEHGLIMFLYSATPRQTYIHAVQKLFYKTSAEEYFLPIFDQMGEQPIENREIHIDHVDPQGTFGYVPKFMEYRSPFNYITGEFKTTLSSWHLGRNYLDTIALDTQFFEIRNPDQIFSVDTDEANSILVQVYNGVYINRPLTRESVPTLKANRQAY